MRRGWIVVGLVAAGLLCTERASALPARPALAGAVAAQQPIGTAFTYQGRLTQNDAPADGPHDLRIFLYDADAGGSQIGETVLLEDVDVDQGIFTVRLDFGTPFVDEARWLEIAVRPGESTGAFATLLPRQALTPVPFALRAAGTWQLMGNAGLPEGSFLGTTDAAPLVFKTNDREAMRVDGEGRVGIGVAVPETVLDVRTTGSGTALQATASERAIVGRQGDAGCGSNAFAVGGCASTGTGVRGESASGIAVHGIGSSGPGVIGSSSNGNGVEGRSTGAIGVFGNSTTRGVVGTLGNVSCAGPYAVGGCADAAIAVRASSQSATAVDATSSSGNGVTARSNTGIGVHGNASARGVVGTLGGVPCPGQYAVGGCSGGAVAVGVYGRSNNTIGMMAHTDSGELFAGVVGAGETRVARIDAAGRGYFNGGTQTGGADYAESMPTSEDPTALEPGDVLALDPASPMAVRRTDEPASRLLVGVYSTRPSILAVGEHGVDDPLTGEVPVALLGIVPTKASAENGAIAVGDLLVSASRRGYAMKAVPAIVGGVPVYPTGAILGKAMEPLDAGSGLIRVLVTLR